MAATTATRQPLSDGSSAKAPQGSRCTGQITVSTQDRVSISGRGSIIYTLHILRIGPASGVGLKIWQCFDNLQAQGWYYTDDQRIDLNGTGLNVPPFLSSLHDSSFLRLPGQCVDLPNGVEVNGNQIQTWECSSGNTNQIWTQALFLPIVGVCLFSTLLFFFVIPALTFCSPSTLMHVINQYLRNIAAHRPVLEV